MEFTSLLRCSQLILAVLFLQNTHYFVLSFTKLSYSKSFKQAIAMSQTSSTSFDNLPAECDYLVVGGGATGMAFVDTLLKHSSSEQKPSIVMVDQHALPGGHWNDSYGYVRLHQPSSMYGVESTPLEPHPKDDEHRATRLEIVQYYEGLLAKWQEAFPFVFVGNARVDLAHCHQQPPNEQQVANLQSVADASVTQSIRIRQRLVDARYLEPDIPKFVPPQFTFDSSVVNVLTPNELMEREESPSSPHHYCVIGAGKTGMDTVVYLLTVLKADPSQITWIIPNEAWITARENMKSCMEFLHTCCQLYQQGTSTDPRTTDFLQAGFREWEKQGHIYRLAKDIEPTKFKDATLSKEEMATLQRVTNILRNGRVAEITKEGAIIFADGTKHTVSSSAQDVTFVHCSAGAFQYTKQTQAPPPMFQKSVITIQDVYGTPGFCFVGSMIGFLESLARLSDEERNQLCLKPTPDVSQLQKPLGPSGGDVGVLSPSHGLVQRVTNLKEWMAVPEIRAWITTNRLFNMNHKSPQEIDAMVDDIWKVLEKIQVVN